MTITDKNVLPPGVRDYYDRLLLTTMYPNLIYSSFAQKRILPKKSGDTVVHRRFGKLDTVPIPLKDGITPPGTSLDATDIKTRVSFYGNYVTITNEVQLTVQDRILNESTKLLGQNGAQTIDEVVRDVLVSTSSVILAANGANGGTPTELTKADIDAVVRILLSNDAKMISEVIKPSSYFATTPVRPAFWGFIHSDLVDDLENVSGFSYTSNYSQMLALDSEWGSTGNVRWKYTSAGSVSGGVYNLPIVAKEGYGIVHLRAETCEFYVNPLGSSGAADPLHQRGTIGWSHPFAARLLNDLLVINLKVTHS
jgi:N4-gp56 family major capsid protein